MLTKKLIFNFDYVDYFKLHTYDKNLGGYMCTICYTIDTNLPINFYEVENVPKYYNFISKLNKEIIIEHKNKLYQHELKCDCFLIQNNNNFYIVRC